MEKGENYYIFQCGCASYEANYKIKNIRVCPIHKVGLREVHTFCQICGLHMIDTPAGQPKKYCDYPQKITNLRGEISRVMGCTGMRNLIHMRKVYNKLRDNRPRSRAAPRKLPPIVFTELTEQDYEKRVRKIIKSVLPAPKLKFPTIEKYSISHAIERLRKVA